VTRRRATRLLLVVASVVVLTLVAASVAAVLVVRRPLPQTTGTLDVDRLSGEVTVDRDDRGVPTITATTAEDLFLAQGFVHAQDRFFEMDYRRHVTAGRLSELVGENRAALAADRVIRTFGWRLVAEAEWELLDDSTRSYLEAYADGVNAYLDQRAPEGLGVEYTVLGMQVDVDRPEPWDPVDSLAWLKAMAWDLRGNYDEELARATAFASVTDVARVEELFPDYPQDVNLPILPSAAEAVPTSQAVAPSGTASGTPSGTASGTPSGTTSDPASPPAGDAPAADFASPDLQRALASASDALAAVPHLVGEGEGVGSNSWVVSGDHTSTGLPLLANDPHLSISAPGIWSQVGLRCAEVSAECPFDVSGFSFAGFPGVIIGHNADLAWGLTNLGADVTDFYIERTSVDTYLRDGVREPVTTRTETIRVNGADDVDLEVRSTVHGPIVSSVLPETIAARVGPLVPEGQVGSFEIALSWTALTPGRTADAVFAFNTATGPEDVAAAAALFDVPSQNIVFATTEGQIGYQAPGRIPIRTQVPGLPAPTDGTWPQPGWDSRFDWQGFVDPADMPAVVDPEEGFIVAANQAVTPAGSGPFLSSDWDYGFRAQRIRTVLEETIAAGDTVDAEAMADLQMDERNPYAQVLVDTLLEVDLASSFDAAGQDLLRDWDGVSDVDSAGAAYFAGVWSTLLELVFWDELPDSARPSGGDRWLQVMATLLGRPDDPWWDDRTTVGLVEGRDEILSRALTSARLELAVELGKDASGWEWGRLHLAAPQHAVLGGDGVPWFVRRLVNPDAVAVGGSSAVVNATSWDADTESYEVTAAPSMRMVVDLADLDASTWVNLTGTSGHPASPHYDDQLDDWAAGRTFPWPFTADATEDASTDRLTLRPPA
jgi:penicillin amidase